MLEVIFRDNFIAILKCSFHFICTICHNVVEFFFNDDLSLIQKCRSLSWCVHCLTLRLRFQNTIFKCIVSMRSHYHETREFLYLTTKFNADKLWENYAIEFFHNCCLIRRIEQEKITKKFRLDQELNPGHLMKMSSFWNKPDKSLLRTTIEKVRSPWGFCCSWLPVGIRLASLDTAPKSLFLR